MAYQYITTPIYYVNGSPHIGHAHTSIMGDILKRYHLMHGEPTLYSTGTDEHGQKIQQVIEASGMEAEDFLAVQAGRFQELFDRCNVSYDIFVRTTHESHKRIVQEVLQKLYREGLIRKKEYTGLYCVGCEQFKMEAELDDQGRCRDHLTVPQKQTETNYFFALEPHRQWLIDWLTADDTLIRPDNYRREILGMLTEPLDDLCISRPRSRVWHGIVLPFDPNFVSYVWFDALLNYTSNIGMYHHPDFDRWWSNVTHIMAKDIIKTHIIYWPIMLRAAGFNPPKRYRIHGYWVAEGGQKMSKSLGNVVDPSQVIDAFGVDALRYYLAKTMGGNDAQISMELIRAVYNTDLANNIGNLHSRVVKFVTKRCDNRVPAPEAVHPDDQQLQESVARTCREIVDTIDLITLPDTVKSLVHTADTMNTYYNDMEPWKRVKDPSQTDRFLSICYVMLDCLRMFFQAARPIIPESSDKALVSIGADPVPDIPIAWQPKPGSLVPGAPMGETDALFPRID
ncbi:methionine--tRNA ligase [bacterium]|nr:methionine--tRNA ligase [candidate division CSSED10-310 bacterium]